VRASPPPWGVVSAGQPAALAVSIAAALVWSACTSAKFGDGGGGEDAGVESDAGGGGFEPAPDAAPPAPDAGRIVLTQSQSMDIVGFTGVACFDDDDVETVNSFYRVFDLAAEGIAGPIQVTKVIFGVEESVSGSTGLPATVILRTLDGEFTADQNQLALANMSGPPLGSAETVIPEVAFPGKGQLGGILHEVPIQATVPAGSRLVVELTHQALEPGQALLMGANRLDQDGFTYWRAAACELAEPVNPDTIDDDAGDPFIMHWVLVVEGTGG
jgi:hypothetical protein